jgi:hypothetical protein
VNTGDPVFSDGVRKVKTVTKAAAVIALGVQSTDGKGVANGYASLDADGKVPDAQLPDDIGGDPAASIHAADTQATPVDADELGLVASASSWALRKFTWANVKSVLKTYFDGLYSALGHTHAYEPSNANIQSHVTGTGSPHTASGVGAEAANANIQSHVTGTGSPHTAAGVGADASGTAVGAVNAHNIAFDHTKLHAPATAGEGISLFGQQVTNTDLGSVAVTGHEEDFDHTKLHTQGTDQGLDTGGTYAKTAQEIHDAVDLAHSNALDHAAVTVVGGNGLVLFGQQISLDVGPEAAHVASGLHGHPASAISNTPTGNISATDVQAALNELDTEKAVAGAAPTAHASSHKTGGSDSIKLDELAAPTDITTLNASTSLHGLVIKATAPAVRGVLAIDNGETAYKNVALTGVAVADATGAGDVVAQLNALLASLRTTKLITDFTNGFWLTVDTTKAGSASDTFVLPLPSTGTYDYLVDWGEGGAYERSVVNTSLTHVYAAPGTYTIKIIGTFPRVYFNNTGDKLKLTGLQIGSVGWTSMERAFVGCTNLVALTGSSNTAAVANMSYMFYGCTAFNQAVTFSTAAATNMSYMFYGCTAFNQAVAFSTGAVTNMASMFAGCTAFNQAVAFSTGAVTNMSYMFNGCTAFNQSLAALNMAAVGTILNMCNGCNLNAPGTTTNYDATLIAWAAQDLVNSLTMTFGTSKYSTGAAATARQAILDDDLWAITDGGVGP